MRANLLFKSVLYRVYSMGIAFLFFWFVFGEVRIATGYTLILELIKIIQYYCFELFWRWFNRSTNTAN